MELRFVEIRTSLTISLASDQNDIKKEYHTKMYEMLHTAISFVVEDEELYKDFNGFGAGAHLSISFFRGANMYSFKGKAKGATLKRGIYLVEIDQISEIKTLNRRISPRHEMTLSAEVYLISKQGSNGIGARRDAGDLLLSAQTFDISNEGLCIVTNAKLERNEDYVYLLKFAFNHDNQFSIPAKLVRLGNCAQSVQFKYDYGFLFDFTNLPEEKSRLSTAIFNYKINRIQSGTRHTHF